MTKEFTDFLEVVKFGSRSGELKIENESHSLNYLDCAIQWAASKAQEDLGMDLMTMDDILGYELGQKIEPCDDAISRDAVLNAICDYVAFEEYEDKSHTFTVRPLEKRIAELPSVTQKSETVTEFADRCRECGARYGKLLKQKSGKWIWSDEIDRYVCDKCGQSDGKDKEMVESGEYPLSNYCRNCGARMVEPQESEDKE